MCWASKAQEVGQRVKGSWNREEDSMLRQQVDVAIKNRWNSSLKRKFEVESYVHDVGRSCPLLPLKKRRANYMSSDLALLEKGNIAAGETTAVAAIKTLICHNRYPDINAKQRKRQNSESRKLVVLDAISSKSAENTISSNSAENTMSDAWVLSSHNTDMGPEELVVLPNMSSRNSCSPTNKDKDESCPSHRTDKVNLWSSNCRAGEMHQDQEEPCTLLRLALPGSCPPEISHLQSRQDKCTSPLNTESIAVIQTMFREAKTKTIRNDDRILFSFSNPETAKVLKEMVGKEIKNYISSEMIWGTIRESIEKEISSEMMRKSRLINEMIGKEIRNYISSGMFREAAQIKEMIGTVIWAAVAEEGDGDKNPSSPSNQDTASMLRSMLRKEVSSCMTAEMVRGEIRSCARELMTLGCSRYLDSQNNDDAVSNRSLALTDNK